MTTRTRRPSRKPFGTTPTDAFLFSYLETIHAEVCGSSLDPLRCATCMECVDHLAAVLPRHEAIVRTQASDDIATRATTIRLAAERERAPAPICRALVLREVEGLAAAERIVRGSR